MVLLLRSDFGGLVGLCILLVNIRESLRVGMPHIEGRVQQLVNSSRTHRRLQILCYLRLTELQKAECFHRCLRRKPTLNLVQLLLKLYQPTIKMRLVFTF